jgi:hypothetical protein
MPRALDMYTSLRVPESLCLWISSTARILNTRETTFRKLDLIPSSEEGGRYLLYWAQWLRLAVPKGPNRIGPARLTWRRTQIRFPKWRGFVVFRVPDDGQCQQTHRFSLVHTIVSCHFNWWTIWSSFAKLRMNSRYCRRHLTIIRRISWN